MCVYGNMISPFQANSLKTPPIKDNRLRILMLGDTCSVRTHGMKENYQTVSCKTCPNNTFGYYLISVCYPGPHIFMPVISLTEYTEEEKKSGQKIQEIYGAIAGRYSMVLFTHEDSLEGKTIEDVLAEDPGLQELVDKCNGQYHVFNNKLKEDKSQADELLQKIQNIVQKNGGSHYTMKMFGENREKKCEKREMVEKKLQEKNQREMQSQREKAEERKRGMERCKAMKSQWEEEYIKKDKIKEAQRSEEEKREMQEKEKQREERRRIEKMINETRKIQMERVMQERVMQERVMQEEREKERRWLMEEVKSLREAMREIIKKDRIKEAQRREEEEERQMQERKKQREERRKMKEWRRKKKCMDELLKKEQERIKEARRRDEEEREKRLDKIEKILCEEELREEIEEIKRRASCYVQ